jgi:hypothetical protein
MGRDRLSVKCKASCSMKNPRGGQSLNRRAQAQHGIDRNPRTACAHRLIATARTPSERTSNGQEHDLPMVR